MKERASEPASHLRPPLDSLTSTATIIQAMQQCRGTSSTKKKLKDLMSPFSSHCLHPTCKSSTFSTASKISVPCSQVLEGSVSIQWFPFQPIPSVPRSPLPNHTLLCSNTLPLKPLLRNLQFWVLVVCCRSWTRHLLPRSLLFLPSNHRQCNLLLPWNLLPCNLLPCNPLPCNPLPCYLLSCNLLLCNLLPCNLLPCYLLQCNPLLYKLLPYHPLPCKFSSKCDFISRSSSFFPIIAIHPTMHGWVVMMCCECFWVAPEGASLSGRCGSTAP